jgi:hypothetical protein
MRPTGGKPLWLPNNPKAPKPNHEWDKGSMLMAVQAHVGIIGSGAREPDEAEVVREA